MCERSRATPLPSPLPSGEQDLARGAVRKTDDAEAMAAVDEALERRQIKITEVMDILWTIQEIVFDLMLPWRTELPEDVEVEGDEFAIGPGFWREFRLRP